MCCLKRLCIFGPKGAIQIRYYYYFFLLLNYCYSDTIHILAAVRSCRLSKSDELNMKRRQTITVFMSLDAREQNTVYLSVDDRCSFIKAQRLPRWAIHQLTRLRWARHSNATLSTRRRKRKRSPAACRTGRIHYTPRGRNASAVRTTEEAEPLPRVDERNARRRYATPLRTFMVASYFFVIKATRRKKCC